MAEDEPGRVVALNRVEDAANYLSLQESRAKAAHWQLADVIREALQAGWDQAEVGKAIGWDRRKVHRFLRRFPSGVDMWDKAISEIQPAWFREDEPF